VVQAMPPGSPPFFIWTRSSPTTSSPTAAFFAWHDVRENPDTFQCLSTFKEKEVLYSYSTTFGSGLWRPHTIIRGTKGTLSSTGRGRVRRSGGFQAGGTHSGWRSNTVFQFEGGASEAGSRFTITWASRARGLVHQNDNLKVFTTDNLVSSACAAGPKPNGNIETGLLRHAGPRW